MPAAEGHYGSVGLMGNANDVGTFLAVPAVAAVVMAVTSIGKRRWIYLGVAVLLVSGMIASATRTALVAFVASMLVLAVVQARRAAVAIGVVLLVVGLAVLSPATTIGRSVRELGDAAMKRDYQRLFSERLLPFLAAAEMTRDHPLLGVGPGCFRYHFMAYRVALADEVPAEWTRGFPMNWGTVHNDHLQVAAEAGVVGYVLFLASLGLLARRSAAGEMTPRAAFARTLRWPLAHRDLSGLSGAVSARARGAAADVSDPRRAVRHLGSDRCEELTVALRRGGHGDSWSMSSSSWRRVRDPSSLRDPLPRQPGHARRSRSEWAIVQSVDPARAVPLARANLADLDRIARSRRLDPAWYMFYGANCEILERWQDAADAYTRALAIDQRPEIYFSRGLVMLHLGRIDQAAADMITAVRFNPFLIDQIGGELRARVAAEAGLPDAGTRKTPMRVMRLIARLNVGGPARHVVWLNEALAAEELRRRVRAAARHRHRSGRRGGHDGVRRGARRDADHRAVDEPRDVGARSVRGVGRVAADGALRVPTSCIRTRRKRARSDGWPACCTASSRRRSCCCGRGGAGSCTPTTATSSGTTTAQRRRASSSSSSACWRGSIPTGSSSSASSSSTRSATRSRSAGRSSTSSCRWASTSRC